MYDIRLYFRVEVPVCTWLWTVTCKQSEHQWGRKCCTWFGDLKVLWPVLCWGEAPCKQLLMHFYWVLLFTGGVCCPFSYQKANNLFSMSICWTLKGVTSWCSHSKTCTQKKQLLRLKKSALHVGFAVEGNTVECRFKTVSCCVIPTAKKETGMQIILPTFNPAHLYLILFHSLLVQAEDMLVPRFKRISRTYTPPDYIQSAIYIHIFTLCFVKIESLYLIN